MHYLDGLHSHFISLALLFDISCFLALPTSGLDTDPKLLPYTYYPHFYYLIMDGILGLDGLE
jgi:hypothetical protein